ncbi:AAA family ATPase [Methanotrichaceae archaeon M04Ac]|uniref:AAA family ATPase n=1 Tax=Candidatus Methanocrinis alkalitolerans TaxID=3033395 RepID=A0ABT5XE42_9EURY|nr:AAA family ATPase [Candidatus Methanocrinis alkalitolerans]MDF0592985.1 AAA family ATPase [Candidatus Methanocrinis alkalitolerans]
MILDEKIHRKILEAYEWMNKEKKLSSGVQSNTSDDLVYLMRENLGYLRFHLIKMLQNPPQENKLDAYFRQYEAIAQELGISRHSLMSLLEKINGLPHRYWSIATTRGLDWRGERAWDFMRDGFYVSIGWTELGDLSDITPDKAGKEKIREILRNMGYDSTNSRVNPPFKFTTEIKKGDLVVVSRLSVLGFGRVVGDYYYEKNDADPWPHRIPVEWISFEKWTLPRGRLQTALYEIKDPINLIEIERRRNSVHVKIPPPIQSRFIIRVRYILERRGQVIIYGPPGTGKTYWAEKAAFELAARSNFLMEFDQLVDYQKSFLTGDGESFGAVRTCCFHPAYGYEDFIEGYRPEQAEGQMIFSLRDGVFKRLCKDALENPQTSFYLIIDEINRGDIPRIFGELMTIIEKDKRGKSITLPISGEQFKVPSNVYIIGTMNTADRSIALLDAALRRRFGFIELMPDPSVLGGATIEGIHLGRWLEALNQKICKNVARDARNLQIGHSYLLRDNGTPIANLSEFAKALHEEMIPLLEEYCYEDFRTLEKILGSGIVDANYQKIRNELFKRTSQEELLKALALISIETLEK